MEENWRDVPGYEGLYQISIDTPEGRCRRLHMRGTFKLLCNTPCKRDNRILWHLCKDGKSICHQAAIWIALTFPELVENEHFEGAHIDHKDTDRLNNRPSNLRWVTPKENNNNPLTLKHLSEVMVNRKDQSKQICQYDKQGVLMAIYPSLAEAERQTGILKTNISHCCLNKRWTDKYGFNHQAKTAGGFIWKYTN